MLTLLIIVLAKIITILGIGALLAIITYISFIALRFILGKVRAFLQKKVGGKVAILSVSSLVEEIAKQKQKSNDVVSLDQLEQELQGEGVVIANLDANGKIESTDDIEILKADDMEESLKSNLRQRDGVMIVKN